MTHLRLGGFRYLVGARRHDEVVAVQALDRVAPPVTVTLPHSVQQAQMVAFGLGYLADGIGKGQGVLEVLRQVDLLQLHDTVADFDVPIRNLPQQHGQFFVADVQGVGAAGFAMGLGECGHGGSPWLSHGRGGRAGPVHHSTRPPRGQPRWWRRPIRPLLGREQRRVQAQAHGLVDQCHDVFLGQLEQALEVEQDEIERLQDVDAVGRAHRLSGLKAWRLVGEAVDGLLRRGEDAAAVDALALVGLDQAELDGLQYRRARNAFSLLALRPSLP